MRSTTKTAINIHSDLHKNWVKANVKPWYKRWYHHFKRWIG